MALKGRYIDRQPLNSSALVSVGYHPEDQTLAVEFASGVHHLADVTPEEFAAFQASESKGKHFHQFLRSKPSTKVEAPRMGTCEKCGTKGLTGFLCQDCGTSDYA